MKGRSTLKVKKISKISGNCVACGSCTKACPLSALSVYKGLYASVDDRRCVGCGKCEGICPAQAIKIIERQGA